MLAFLWVGCLGLMAAEFSKQADGFEASALAPFWLPGDYGSGLYAAGAVKISTNHARAGAKSLEVTVREGDMASPGGDGFTTERADMDSGHYPLLNQDAWYSFSVLFPTNFPLVDTRLVFGTCKQSDVARPIVAQRFRKGRHTLTVEAHGKRKEFSLPKPKLGAWHDMVYHLRYAEDKTGRVEVWMDGKKVADYAGPTAEPNFKNAFYFKMGLYRDQMKQPMTAYFDNYAAGTNAAALNVHQGRSMKEH